MEKGWKDTYGADSDTALLPLDHVAYNFQKDVQAKGPTHSPTPNTQMSLASGQPVQAHFGALLPVTGAVLPATGAGPGTGQLTALDIQQMYTANLLQLQQNLGQPVLQGMPSPPKLQQGASQAAYLQMAAMMGLLKPQGQLGGPGGLGAPNVLKKQTLTPSPLPNKGKERQESPPPALLPRDVTNKESAKDIQLRAAVSAVVNALVGPRAKNTGKTHDQADFAGKEAVRAQKTAVLEALAHAWIDVASGACAAPMPDKTLMALVLKEKGPTLSSQQRNKLEILALKIRTDIYTLQQNNELLQPQYIQGTKQQLAALKAAITGKKHGRAAAGHLGQPADTDTQAQLRALSAQLRQLQNTAFKQMENKGGAEGQPWSGSLQYEDGDGGDEAGSEEDDPGEEQGEEHPGHNNMPPLQPVPNTEPPPAYGVTAMHKRRKTEGQAGAPSGDFDLSLSLDLSKPVLALVDTKPKVTWGCDQKEGQYTYGVLNKSTNKPVWHPAVIGFQLPPVLPTETAMRPPYFFRMVAGLVAKTRYGIHEPLETKALQQYRRKLYARAIPQVLLGTITGGYAWNGGVYGMMFPEDIDTKMWMVQEDAAYYIKSTDLATRTVTLYTQKKGVIGKRAPPRSYLIAERQDCEEGEDYAGYIPGLSYVAMEGIATQQDTEEWDPAHMLPPVTGPAVTFGEHIVQAVDAGEIHVSVIAQSRSLQEIVAVTRDRTQRGVAHHNVYKQSEIDTAMRMTSGQEESPRAGGHDLGANWGKSYERGHDIRGADRGGGPGRHGGGAGRGGRGGGENSSCL